MDMAQPARLTGIRVAMIGTLAIAAVGAIGVACAEQLDARVPIKPQDLAGLDVAQLLTYIVLAMIALTGFLAWMGFKRLAGIENAIREHILKLDQRKCLLSDREYLEHLRHPTP